MSTRPSTAAYRTLLEGFAGPGEVARAFRLGPVDAATVSEAYRLTKAYYGPIATRLAHAMLRDFKATARERPDHRVLFLGRDGHFLAAATRGLDPAFYAARGFEAPLSRVLVDAAVQDLEANHGVNFDRLERLRTRKFMVDQEGVDGAYGRLTRFLHANGVPVGRPGSSVTVVDIGIAGRVQSSLAEMYRATRVTGAYATHSRAEHDPYAHFKKGYWAHVVRQDYTLPELPLHPAAGESLFASLEGLRVMEFLKGPLSTADAIGADGVPEQTLQGDDPKSWSGLTGINPVVLAPEYAVPEVRDAVRTAALTAIRNHASQFRLRLAAQGPEALTTLNSQAQLAEQHFGAWVHRTGTEDPQLRSLLDSFVRRSGHEAEAMLHKFLASHDISKARAQVLWHALARMEGNNAKAQFVYEHTRAMAKQADQLDRGLNAAAQGIPTAAPTRRPRRAREITPPPIHPWLGERAPATHRSWERSGVEPRTWRSR